MIPPSGQRNGSIRFNVLNKCTIALSSLETQISCNFWHQHGHIRMEDTNKSTCYQQIVLVIKNPSWLWMYDHFSKTHSTIKHTSTCLQPLLLTLVCLMWPKLWIGLWWSVNNESVMSGLPGPVIGGGPSGALVKKDTGLFFICPALMRTQHGQQQRERESGAWLPLSVCVCVCACITSCDGAVKVWLSVPESKSSTQERERERDIVVGGGDSKWEYKHTLIIKC